MTRKQDDYLGDDRATQCGAYIKHRMPELTDAQARDAATMALSWVGDNPLWSKPALKTTRTADDFDEAGPYGENNGPVDAELDLVAARLCLDAREEHFPFEVDAAARLLMERGTPGDKARAGVWLNARKTEAE